MFRKFFKYVTQSMAGMRYFFYFAAFRCEWSDGSESDPAGLRRAVCNRGNDRNRFCDKILHHKIKR